jgi:hypothetical protein
MIQTLADLAGWAGQSAKALRAMIARPRPLADEENANGRFPVNSNN